MYFKLIVRGRLPSKKGDDFLDSINETMNDFGFNEKITFDHGIATTKVTLKGVTVEEWKTLDPEVTQEAERMMKEDGEKIFSEHFRDVNIKVTGPFKDEK